MDTDIISIRLVPEKKGLILKHSEYEIISKKYNITVVRRYNDFVTLQSLLLTRFPYRMLPRLPPKQIMLDSLLEERRRGLQRWLHIVCQHPILGNNPMTESFLTDKSNEHQEHLRVIATKESDEFSKLSDNIELPLEDQGRLAATREMMRMMLNCVTRLKRLSEQQVTRVHNQGLDMNEMSSILKTIETSSKCYQQGTFVDMILGLQDISTISAKSANNQNNAIIHRINLLLDVLISHSDLCDRVEKGIVSDHQRALHKMLTINKQKIKGVIRGSAAENVAALHEQEVTQTGVVGSLGRRSAFSLYCVLQETELAQKYLQILPKALLSFSYEQQQHSIDTLKVWEKFVSNN